MELMGLRKLLWPSVEAVLGYWLWDVAGSITWGPFVGVLVILYYLGVHVGSARRGLQRSSCGLYLSSCRKALQRAPRW